MPRLSLIFNQIHQGVSMIQAKLMTLRSLWQDLAKVQGVLVVMGVLLLTAASKIVIPIQPVPITLQSIVVLLLGLFYTPRAAFYSIATWLLLATCGLPVLASPIAIRWWTAPSAGYLIGFLVSATLMAILRKKTSNGFWQTLGNCFLGQVIIYGFGVGWLMVWMGCEKAVQLGLMPFMLPGLVKAFLLVTICRSIGRSTR
ncbi:MAG: biotin transporter BioY [Candidatus Symbiodolus clandestinus]